MNDHPAWFSSRGLQALALALLTGLTASGPTRAEDVQVNITADNAYAFGFGSRDEIESFFGGVQNCSSGAIFFQPESYTIPNAAPEDYLYIIAWSDDSTTQGVLGAFSTAAGSVYTGAGNWEVFATGINLDPPIGNACVTGPAANTPSLGSLNAQIAIANQNAGNASTTSRGWVGPTGGAGMEEVAFGEANDTAPGIFPQVPAISQQAHWMWYNRDPQSIAIWSASSFISWVQHSYLADSLRANLLEGLLDDGARPEDLEAARSRAERWTAREARGYRELRARFGPSA